MFSGRRFIQYVDSQILRRKPSYVRQKEIIEFTIFPELTFIFFLPVFFVFVFFSNWLLSQIAFLIYAISLVWYYNLKTRLYLNTTTREVSVSYVFLNKYILSHRHFQYHDTIELLVKREEDSESAKVTYQLFIKDAERDRYLLSLPSMDAVIKLKEIIADHEIIFHGQKISLYIDKVAKNA